MPYLHRFPENWVGMENMVFFCLGPKWFCPHTHTCYDSYPIITATKSAWT